LRSYSCSRAGALSGVDGRSVGDWLDAKYNVLANDPPAGSTPPAVVGTPTDFSTVMADIGS
jgi:hypothetical protein